MAQVFSAARAACTPLGYSKTIRQWIFCRWRPAFPAARWGSSGGSALGGGFLALLRYVRFVGGGVHQVAGPRGICQAYFDQPSSSMRIAVDGFRFVLQLAVNLNYFAV